MPPANPTRIARHATRKPTPTNPTQHRNRINQTAHRYAISERHVHAALYHYSVMLRRLEEATP